MIFEEQQSLRFRLAQLSDLPALMLLVEDGQKSLMQLGVDQWQDGYPTIDVIVKDIRTKHCFLLENEKNIVAMSTLIFNIEPSYNIIEGAWLTRGKFGVVHRIAVSSLYKRQGIAQYFLSKLEEHCLKNNIFSIKIDTHEGNFPMRLLLDKQQYSYCGIIWLPSGKPRCAYEKILEAAFNYQTCETPIGILHLYTQLDDKALLAVCFAKNPNYSVQQITTPLLKKVIRQLNEYFNGQRTVFRLPIKIKGTLFQKKVWRTLQAIPYGETRAYGQIAAQIGKKKACRAVGMANNRNPIPIIIPCHRVIGGNGGLIGYAGGLSAKQFLLEMEKRYKIRRR